MSKHKWQCGLCGACGEVEMEPLPPDDVDRIWHSRWYESLRERLYDLHRQANRDCEARTTSIRLLSADE